VIRYNTCQKEERELMQKEHKVVRKAKTSQKKKVKSNGSDAENITPNGNVPTET